MRTKRPVLPATLSLAAASLLAVGCEEASFVDPAVGVEQPEVTAAASRAQTTRDVPVFWFAGPTLVPGASSKITRNDAGATATLRTNGLIPGNAYTMWMVVFNVPGNCATKPCGEADVVPGTDVVVDVVYVAGNVVGGSGKATFSGRRVTGDNGKSLFAQLGAPAPGLTDPHGAEMHLIVRDHGPKIPGLVSEQIHTFEGGCTPESSLGLGSGSNTCADVQFSVHEPPS